MTWIAGIAMLLISIFSAGGLAFGLWSKLGLPNEAKYQVASQVPPVVASSLSQSVPSYVETEIAGQMPVVVEQIRNTVIAEVVPTAFADIQTQSAIAASTAIQETIGNFTIVVSSDYDLEGAKFAANQAERFGYDPVIYKIGEYFATTVGRYSTEEQLRTDLEEIRKSYQPSAYYLNLSKSCPYPKLFSAGYYGCFEEPQE